MGHNFMDRRDGMSCIIVYSLPVSLSFANFVLNKVVSRSNQLLLLYISFYLLFPSVLEALFQQYFFFIRLMLVE